MSDPDLLLRFGKPPTDPKERDKRYDPWHPDWPVAGVPPKGESK